MISGHLEATIISRLLDMNTVILHFHPLQNGPPYSTHYLNYRPDRPLLGLLLVHVYMAIFDAFIHFKIPCYHVSLRVILYLCTYYIQINENTLFPFTFHLYLYWFLLIFDWFFAGTVTITINSLSMGTRWTLLPSKWRILR